MRFFSLMFVLCSVLMSGGAMGGGSAGGSGWGRTIQLLKGLPYSEAVLTVEGVTTIPQSDPTPRLPIPKEEYDFLLSELGKNVPSGDGSKTIVLSVDLDDGSVRNFVLSFTGKLGVDPVFLRVVEDLSPSQKYGE